MPRCDLPRTPITPLGAHKGPLKEPIKRSVKGSVKGSVKRTITEKITPSIEVPMNGPVKEPIRNSLELLLKLPFKESVKGHSLSLLEPQDLYPPLEHIPQNVGHLSGPDWRALKP